MKILSPSKLACISKSGLLTLALLAASSAATRALDISWTGGTAEYTNAGDWGGGVVPGLSDNAINDNGTNNVVQIINGDPSWSVNDLRAGNATSASGAYYQDGPSAILGGWLRLGIGSGSTGVYTLNSGNIAINANRLNVGELGTGILYINGGTISGPNNQFALADGPTGASGTVNQTGGTVTSPGELWVGANNAGSGGNGATAIYNFSGGILNINNWAVLGRNGTTGTFNMTGGTFNKNGNGNFLIASGNGSIGTFNHSGGAIVSQAQFLVPDSGDNTTLGTYNISNNASLLVNNWFAVGRNGGVGIVNIAGGSITKTGDNTSHLDVGAGGLGTINQSGGAVTNVLSDTWIGENSTAVWNLFGGSATLGSIHIGQLSTSTGTLNVHTNAILTTTELTTGNPTAISTFNIDGGVIRASASSGSFIHDLVFFNLASGGMTIDSQGFNIVVPQNLPNNGDPTGGLIKNGTGTLTLTGANSYQGPTRINAGTLVLTTDPTGPTGHGDYTVAGGAQLNLTVQGQNDELTVGNLTFATGAPVLNLDLGSFGNPAAGSAPVNATGILTVNGTVSVNIADALPQIGQFPLIQFASRSGSGSFVLSSLPVGVGAYLSNNISSIDLVITNVNLPRWEGLAGGNWDIGITTNWINIGNNLPTTYADHNIVLFNDSAAGTTTVNLTTTLNPNGLTVNNNSLPYTFTGPGKISGPVGINKQGAGTLVVVNNGGNNYTGPTVIGGGVLSVTNLTNGGLPSAIGAGSANPTNLVLSGGALSYSGPPITINRGYLTISSNSALTTVSNVTLTGMAAATSPGGLIKNGDGQLTYTTVGTNVLSAAGSQGYSVQDGNVIFDGTAGGQTNYVSSSLGVDGLLTNSTVTLTNTTLNITGDLDLGDIANATGTVNINGGTTVNVSSWVIFGNGGNSTGTLNLNAGTLNDLTGDLLMGGNAGALSTLNISGGVFNKAGGTVNIAPGNWNGNGARTGTINQSAGTFNCSDEINVGQAAFGTGYYNLTNGILNAHNGLYVGNAGSFGQFTMTGGTITKDGGNPIKIGNGGGVAVFNQSGGTINSSSEYWVAENNGTVGTNNISGSAAVNVSTYVTVGRAGLGVVNLTGGTFTQTGGNPFFVGIFGGGNGYWTQTGGALGVSATLEIGSGCNGNFELDNGVANAAGEVWIAQSTGAYGVFTINGGAFTNNSWLAIGRENGNGTLNINGGTMVKTGGGNISIAHGIGGVAPTGMVTQVSGKFLAISGDIWIGEDSGPGTWNMNGGSATMNQVLLAKNSNASGTLNLNGGTFAANEVTTASSGVSTLNWNGGTLVATINIANYLHGLTTANVLAGGAVIDSGANTITASQPLLDGGGGGGLTKLGLGTLTLTGSNTYTGPTAVNAGKLIITTASSGGGNITVANAAGFGVTVVNALNSQYTAPGLTFAGPTASLNFDLGTFGNPTLAPLNVTALANNATVTVNIADAVPAAGQIPLLKYTGTITGSGSFVLGSIPTGSVGFLSNNIANSSIDFVVTSAGAPRWNGNLSSVWDINTTANWFDLGTASSTTYHDGTPVLFDDNATPTATNVTLNVTVSPASIRVTNNILPYTLSGSATGKISGSGGLTKQGTNSLTLLSMNGNNFTGPVTISAGTLTVTNLANGGSPSSIGASSANPTNLVLAGGTFSYGGPAVSVNRGYAMTANSVLDVQGALTLTGVAQATSGTIAKTGPATLTYAGVGTNLLTPANVGGAYQVKAGGVVFDGTGGAQSNSIIGEMWVGSVTNSAGSVVVTNSALGITSWFALGRGNGNSGFLSTASIYNSLLNISYGNTGSGGAGSGGGISLGYNNGLPNAGTQVMTLAGSTIATNYGGNFNIAESTGSSSTFTVTNSAYITSIYARCLVGNTASKGVVNLNSTATSTFCTTSGQIFLGGFGGTTDPGAGALNISAGTARFGNGSGVYVHLGDNGGTVPTSYGSFNQSGGTFNQTSGDGFRVGYGGYGSFVQSGGTLLCGRWFSIGGNTAGGNGVATFTGGTAGIFNTGFRILLPDVGNATGVLNLGTEAGGTSILTNLSTTSVAMENNAGGNGTLNLNSGTLQLGGPITRISSVGGSAVVNLNGGKLQAGANSITLLDNTLSSENVYKGGLTVDTFGNIATVSGNLLTTPGNGIYPAGGLLTVPGNGGSGYIGAPLVTVTGGSGSGAMAIATVSGGVVTNVVMTAPGKNYVAGDVVSFAFAGGGATTAATTFAYTLQAGDVAANGGGGLTKTGSGTLYLTGGSTYTGSTLVSAGTLGGTGSLFSPLTVAAGATLSPGVGAIGTLTVSNTVTLAAGSTNYMEINVTAGTKDLLRGASQLNYGGTLVIANLAGTFTAPSSFKLYDATTYTGSFSAIVPATPGTGLMWDTTQLAVSGTLSVATASSVNTTPTNIVTSVSGGNLNLTWPADHTGWRLQIETNSLAVGLNPANPAVFLRLVYP